MFWMSMVRNGCGKYGDRILKFIKEKTEERTDGINCLHVDAWSQKSKADQSFLGGHGQKTVWPVWSRDSDVVMRFF